MNWIRNLNQALEYIESNLDSKIDSAKAAEIACSSKFHFLRVFTMLTQKTLGEYVRDRRMTLAGEELQRNNHKVIEIALKYGYDTPEAFAKAFKRFHGISPRHAKEEGVQLKAALPLHFRISVKGEERMKYRIIEKEAFKVTGPSVEVTTVENKNFEIIPKFWQDLWQKGEMSKLMEVAGPMMVMGICYNFRMNQEVFDYMAGVECNAKNEGLYTAVAEIPALTWAIFEGYGKLPDSLQECWKRIFEEWFPASQYQHAEGPEIELYWPQDESGQNKWEIWVPVEIK